MQIMPVIIPSLKLVFFAPFLILAANETRLEKQLFPAFITGIILDLFAYGMPFGFYTLLATLTVLLSPLWIRSYFKNESIIYITSGFLFIWTWTFLEAILSMFFKMPSKISIDWILYKTFVDPIINIAYFGIAILLPLKLACKPKEEVQ